MLDKIMKMLFVSLLLCLVSCTHVQKKENLRDDIAQMIVFACDGTTAEKGSDFERLLSQHPFAGVILFDTRPGFPNRNIETPEGLKALTARLQQIAGDNKLLIAVDQEGGKVARLRSQLGFLKHPTPSEFNLLSKEQKSIAAGRLVKELKSYGINLNLAPLVDVNRNPRNFINKKGRTFSALNKEVVESASQFIEEHHKIGLLTSIKHFPGHGSSHGDSHHGMVDVTETWHENELEPYRQLIKKGKVDIVMSAHIFQRKLDPKYPATLSNKIITGILREQLNYQGVVISDDLKMKAIKGRYDSKEAIALMINAGIDLLLISQSNYEEITQTIKIIEELVAEGKVSKESIRESADRVRALKESL